MIPESTLAHWVKITKGGKPLGGGVKQKTVTAQEMELARLKRENIELKMERDILKKAALRTLPRGCCQVRNHERDATLSHTAYVPGIRCITQWLLCMV